MRVFVTNAIYAVFALVELMLGLRLILKLFGADASNAFVSWVYETSGATYSGHSNRGLCEKPRFCLATKKLKIGV